MHVAGCSPETVIQQLDTEHCTWRKCRHTNDASWRLAVVERIVENVWTKNFNTRTTVSSQSEIGYRSRIQIAVSQPSDTG